MGSDHYCLRWNNHQSNLLGVFSQLLRDESLVDVTLACSEGHSIRAHKVVLSACSSYFQTLFVDHPARHPIVILKDVRFAELSTLIEFMYRGEVNVEHCQLSELLRTAESLKVKGLTDMGTTNLPATGLQPPPANKLQLQAQPSQHALTTSSTSTSTSSGITTQSSICCKAETPDNDNPVTMAEPEQTEPTELVNKPSKPSAALSTHHTDREEPNPMVTAAVTCVTTSSINKSAGLSSNVATPLSLVASERRSMMSVEQPTSQQHQFHMPPINQPDQNSNKDSPTRLTLSPQAGSSIESENLRPDSDMDEELDDSYEESEDYKPSDMRLLTTVTAEANRLHQQQQHDGNPVNSVSVRPSSASGLGAGGNSVGMSGLLCRLPSPIIGTAEPIAGPSNIMPPVQQVPLSLKKEVDWGGGSADEKSNIESPSDYPRHSLDPSVTDIERCFVATSPATSSRHSSSRSSTPAFTAFSQQQQHLPSTVNSIAAAVVGFHQQHHHNLTSSLLEAGLVHPALFNAAAAAAAVAAAGVSAAAAAAECDVYRCTACMAAFPSIWLLEQHTALQHIGNLGAASTSSSSTDKPFVCEQCGQSYRYRSAYVKHREQNHRARLPADKLFSCDFCGMQFRYLKSFKKHRLNHALERLHGKANSETRLDIICSREISSGNKETTTTRIDSLPMENSSDQVSSSNETLTIIDDQPAIPSASAYKPESPQLIPDPDDTDMENPSTSGQREHIIVDSDPMQLAANTSDSEPELEQEQDDTVDSAVAVTCHRESSPAVTVVPVATMLPSTSSRSSSGALLPSLTTPPDLTGVASGSMATVEAVEAFRSAQQASIINFLRADAAERQRERRFACPFCGKCVRSKENLKLHVRKHTGERPFVCLFCGRAFGGKSDLTRHLRIHTGERPYHCDMCGKCFARADYLSKHLTTHINTPR